MGTGDPPEKSLSIPLPTKQVLTAPSFEAERLAEAILYERRIPPNRRKFR